MFFTEQDFKMVEAATLSGKTFNPKQREFIELVESKYIIAGPGAGKTTALSAKIVLLLLNSMRTNQREGICIITKTNVAVEEINRILRNVGQSKMKHPHFIGTIHQFFNTYLATPYIKKVLNPKRIRFGKEEDYTSLLNELAERNVYFKNWKDAPRNIAVQKTSKSKLMFDKSSNNFFLENTTEWDKFDRHGKHMFNLKWNLKKLGFFSFEDIFLFSTAAIEDKKTLSLLRKRFRYIFIDEFQDTNSSSIELVNRIFKYPDNVLQFIGDPNQTLDFDGEMPVVDELNVFELNICNRFGNQIGKQLSHIIHDVNIKCLDNRQSFNPLLLIYKTKENLIPHYKKIFNKYLSDEDFASVKKKDSILAIQNNTIDEFQKNLATRISPGFKAKSSESYTKQILSQLHDVLLNNISLAKKHDLKLPDWLNEHPDYKNLKIYLVRSIKSRKLEVEQIVNHLNNLIEEKEGQKITTRARVFQNIAAIIEQIGKKTSIEKIDDFHVFSTIHSAKGETHRSVLLIDSENDKHSKIHTTLLKSYFCEERENISDYWVQRNLLYVAMSRPTHLFAFGMDINFITDEEIELFREKGWDIEFTNE
ncbi:UvrD-helicase domain-containing protein [Paenibacillus profundus]|uniref:UvrD-helicase domain-containing protein n=1 Tax=Paenibacillus profundus TaxID=1173085 RepID=A0ABS8YGL1_9BACL|nr:UvrD-helicase domain-containing protein [Paenibacillus profundus]MCE5169690.1 UvrD-helicase domain-containing protein [Paenibacillus profundus]